MLNMSRTQIHQSREINFVPGYVATEEGTPLVSLLVDGSEAVKGFEGAADIANGAKFAGFSYSETLTPMTANHALIAVTDANGEVVLPYEPITGQISVWTKGAGGSRTRVPSGQVTIDASNPKKITVVDGAGTPAPIATTTIEVVYKYMPTIQTAFFEHRVLIPSVSASAMTNSTGVILEGEVWTDKIDLGSDFDVRTNKLFINANGLVGAAAAVPAGAIEVVGTVIGTPGAENAGTTTQGGGFLGIRYHS